MASGLVKRFKLNIRNRSKINNAKHPDRLSLKFQLTRYTRGYRSHLEFENPAARVAALAGGVEPRIDLGTIGGPTWTRDRRRPRAAGRGYENASQKYTD
jgi:hypothetical protein